MTVAAANTNYEATISTTLAKGWYWLALQKTTGTFSMDGTVQGYPSPTWDVPLINTNMDTNSNFMGWMETAAGATLPATAGTVSQLTGTSVAHLYLRKA